MLLLFILALSQHQASVLHLERHQQPFYAVFYSQTQCRRTSPSHANSGDSSKTNQVSLLQTGAPNHVLVDSCGSTDSNETWPPADS